MLDLGIIIVNWNTKKFLKNCITSVYRNPPDFSYEVIVVDNASTDSSKKMVKEHFPGVKLIQNPSNLGFAAANNLGVECSQGRHILFLNSDTLVHLGTLTGAVKFMDSHPEAGIMGCKTLNMDGTLQPTAYGFPSIVRMFSFVIGMNRILKLSRFKDLSKTRTSGYIQGSFLLVRKNVLEEVGKFDDKFFMYSEDIDLCHRVKLAGWKAYYYPEITITHFGGGSIKDSKQALESFIRSIIYLYRKHRSFGELKLLKIAIVFALIFRALIDFLSSLIRLRQIKKETIHFYRSLISTTMK